MSQIEHRKLFRLFNLLSRLRSPLGCSAEEYCSSNEITRRTYDRYILFLKEFGFEVIKENGRHKIEKVSPDNLQHEDLFVFTLEEATLIRDAIIDNTPDSVLRKELLQKLQALTDLDELSDNIYLAKNSRHISLIRKAIYDKKQIKLLNYQSVNSNSITNRLVEPIRFRRYFLYFEAYEPKSKLVKQFKTDRIGEVKLLQKDWQYEKKHHAIIPDLFGMTGEPVKVRLHLSMLAARLLKEEFPGADELIKESSGKYLFETTVNSYKGIGRFILGLPGEIEVIEPEELNRYLLNQSRKP
jgi:predicted DNA-binding transcriptional regulator YafY